MSAEWPHEVLLLRTLALAASRLSRRHEFSTAVTGFVYGQVEPPPRPVADLAILPGASVYRQLHDWAEPRAGQVVLLGSDMPDLFGLPRYEVDCRAFKTSIKSWSPEFSVIHAALVNGSSIEVQGVLCAAAGCDVPPGFFPSGTLSPAFAEIEDPNDDSPTGWSAPIAGHWLTSVCAEVRRKEGWPALDADTSALLARLNSLGAEGRRCAERVDAGLLQVSTRGFCRAERI